MRVGILLFAALVAVATLLPASVAAQDGEPTTPESSEVYDAVADTEAVAQPFNGRETEDTVIRVRRTLVGIAVATAVGLVAFWWHTAPSRRLRIATRRAADHAMEQD